MTKSEDILKELEELTDLCLEAGGPSLLPTSSVPVASVRWIGARLYTMKRQLEETIKRELEEKYSEGYNEETDDGWNERELEKF